MDEQYQITADAQDAPVIEPGHTFATVTEKISAIVLTHVRITANLVLGTALAVGGVVLILVG